jgi:hypothetical protein
VKATNPVRTNRKNSTRSCFVAASVLLLFALVCPHAYSETPAPSVHWGSLAFPDQYSTFTTGFTTDRFAPVDGNGNNYDSTVPNTLGFNLITFSWTQHGDVRFPGWSFNLTGGIGPTSNQPSDYFQNHVAHQVNRLASVPAIQPREETDGMIDASITKWFFSNRAVFLGGGFSLGTVYQEQFLRAGIRRLQVTPDLYSGEWGDVSVRVSGLGRVSLLESGAVLREVKPTSYLLQPALAIGQYDVSEHGEPYPTWELEVSATWDSGIFVNSAGESQKQYFWSAAFSAGPMRFETWNDTIGNIGSINRTDFGPTYGATLTIDLFRL